MPDILRWMGKYLRILLFFITQKSNDLPRRGAFEHGGFVVGHKVTVHGEGVAIEVGADIDTGFIAISSSILTLSSASAFSKEASTTAL